MSLSATDIYDFAAWLTTRPGTLTIGSSHEAGPMADAVGEYLRAFPERFRQQSEAVTRFCPGCGNVGPVPDPYHDCCPDGGKARMIPEPLARHCHDLFYLALSAPGDALHPQRQSAIDPVTVLRLADIAIDAAVESALHEVGYYELEGDANAHRKAASTKAAEAYAALCRAFGVADLHPQPQLNRAAAEKPKPASVTPLNPAAAWPFPSRSRT